MICWLCNQDRAILCGGGGDKNWAGGGVAEEKTNLPTNCPAPPPRPPLINNDRPLNDVNVSQCNIQDGIDNIVHVFENLGKSFIW